MNLARINWDGVERPDWRPGIELAMRQELVRMGDLRVADRSAPAKRVWRRVWHKFRLLSRSCDEVARRRVEFRGF